MQSFKDPAQLQQAHYQQHAAIQQLAATIQKKVETGYYERMQQSEQLQKEYQLGQYKLTRKQELDLFVTSEIKETKFMLLERRHQRMDEIIKDNADYGGRYIEKQEEPMEAPIETPVV